MKKFKTSWIVFVGILLHIPCILLGDTLSVSGNPAAMTISTATPGSAPNSVSDATTTYNLTTTTLVRVITGKISTAMPTGVTLEVQLAAPAKATSAGSIAMTATAANLVTAIAKNTTANNLVITYTLSATVAAAPATAATKTLTLTLQ